MVGKQSVSASEDKKKSNQAWMDEFSSYTEEAEKLENEAKNQEGENFAQLFEASQREGAMQEGEVLEGTIVSVGSDTVTVDVGFKCEGHIPLYEFKDATGKANVEVGERVSVYLEKLEIENGYLQMSKDKAAIIKAWDEISTACDNNQVVEGMVISKVKGGLSVDIGVKAFLPGSQLDTKPIKNLDPFIGQKLKFKIIKFNKKRGNIVLSRRAVVSEERAQQRQEILKHLDEGMVVKGTVKNITEYGAFIDLGGIDGLLHITDMSWGRIKHPSELFSVNDEIEVKVLKYDREKERVSLGLKQVTANPWDEAEYTYPVSKIVSGTVVSLKDYGAFVELAPGIEGLIHVSEMSWTERVKHPSKLLKVGEEVECKVLEVDTKSKRISLGVKQLQPNPWDALEGKYPVGTIIDEGKVRSVTDFGVFIDVGMGIDGLVHVSDISWTKKFNHPSELYNKGDEVRTVVLGIDRENEKFSLGVKQLERDPWESLKARYRQGDAVEGAITKLTDFGAFVELEEGVEGLIYVSEIADHRIEKPADVLSVGQQVQAEILSIEPKERRIALSIKQLSRSEERANYERHMTGASKKASMGEVLGDKLRGFLGSKEESGEGSDIDTGESEVDESSKKDSDTE